jgi:hypothetical protein
MRGPAFFPLSYVVFSTGLLSSQAKSTAHLRLSQGRFDITLRFRSQAVGSAVKFVIEIVGLREQIFVSAFVDRRRQPHFQRIMINIADLSRMLI